MIEKLLQVFEVAAGFQISGRKCMPQSMQARGHTFVRPAGKKYIFPSPRAGPYAHATPMRPSCSKGFAEQRSERVAEFAAELVRTPNRNYRRISATNCFEFSSVEFIDIVLLTEANISTSPATITPSVFPFVQSPHRRCAFCWRAMTTCQKRLQAPIRPGVE
jgi:hypothetical protein